MASRKAETEKLRSSVSEIRAKTTVVGTDTDSQVKGASFEPSYEVFTQKRTYLMSAVTSQTNQNLNKKVDAQHPSPMEMVSTHPLHFKDLEEMKRI